jgi:DNA-binding PadR family transcriptional regulator
MSAGGPQQASMAVERRSVERNLGVVPRAKTGTNITASRTRQIPHQKLIDESLKSGVEPKYRSDLSVENILLTDAALPYDVLDRVTMQKTAGRNPDEFLPLPGAVFQILVALADRERHGYGIMQDIAERTGGKFRLSPGTLYGSIKRMLEQEFIEESDERPDPSLDDERRRYYRITEFGRRVAGAETERLSRLVSQAVAGLLHGSRPG